MIGVTNGGSDKSIQLLDDNSAAGHWVEWKHGSLSVHSNCIYLFTFRCGNRCFQSCVCAGHLQRRCARNNVWRWKEVDEKKIYTKVLLTRKLFHYLNRSWEEKKWNFKLTYLERERKKTKRDKLTLIKAKKLGWKDSYSLLPKSKKYSDLKITKQGM